MSQDQYCVFGNPIAHSKSPEIHRAFAEQTGEAIAYDKQLVPTDGFVDAAQTFFSQAQNKGLNITVPFKLDAFAYAEELTPRAQAAGAVNTLAKREDGTILGDNTDGAGLVADMLTNLNWSITGKRVLILGAGGAVRGVIQPLLEQQPASVVIANRTIAKAIQLVRLFKADGNIKACGFDDLEGQTFDLVTNGTSASLSGDLPPLPDTLLAENACCYDMMYGAEPTVFLQWANAHGAANIADGLGMLVGQAAESFHLWRGVRPDTTPVINSIRGAL